MAVHGCYVGCGCMEQAARADGLFRQPQVFSIKIGLDPNAQSWFPYGYPPPITAHTFTYNYNSWTLLMSEALESVAEALFGWL